MSNQHDFRIAFLHTLAGVGNILGLACLLVLLSGQKSKPTPLVSPTTTPDESFYDVRASAEAGKADAQFVLGEIFYYGTGETENPAEAAKWYRKAAEEDIPDAQYNIGTMYEKGEGVSRDAQQADLWYRKAVSGYRKYAELGNPASQYRLGECYHHGRGVTRDEVEAQKWYGKAAAQGYTELDFNPFQKRP